MKPISGRWLLPGALALSTLVADCLSKAWANNHLIYGQAREFIPGFLRLTLAHNPGAAFGIGRKQGLLMTILASSIILGIVFWMYRKERSNNPPNLLERCGVGIIIGGAVGNLLDRFTRGEVTDFLDFAFMNFPIFNLADALIDVGAGLVVLSAIAFGSAQEQKQAQKQEQEQESDITGTELRVEEADSQNTSRQDKQLE